MSIYNPVCAQDLAGLLCGGRYNKVAFTLEFFFTKLKNFGAQLVFYKDGPVQEIKTATWLQRQDRKYRDTMQIIDCIEQERYPMKLEDLVNKFRNTISAITEYPFQRIAKQYGTVHTAMDRECDQELAAYATANQALAVISNDTDFLIFEGNWRLWSSKDIDFQKFSTYEYNRTALVQSLQLNYKQMALFATLGGNDIVQYEEVRAFHIHLCQNNKKFYNLANYVRNLPPMRNNQEWVENCTKKVFVRPNEDLRQRVQQSVQFYDLVKSYFI